MVFGEGRGSGRGEFDLLMQEKTQCGVERGGGEGGRVGLLGKWLWQETRQPSPGLGKKKKKCVCVPVLLSL